MALERQNFESTSSWHICFSAVSKHLTVVVTHWWWWHICDRTNKHGVTPARLSEPNRDVKLNPDSFGLEALRQICGYCTVLVPLLFLWHSILPWALWSCWCIYHLLPLAPGSAETSPSFFACFTKALIHHKAKMARWSQLCLYAMHGQQTGEKSEAPESVYMHVYVSVVNKKACINIKTECGCVCKKEKRKRKRKGLKYYVTVSCVLEVFWIQWKHLIPHHWI